MINFIKTIPLIFLLVSHPLEQLSVNNLHLKNLSLSFMCKSNYIAPGNGIIMNIVEINGFYQIMLLLDNGNEVVYSGLSEVTKRVGERVIKNEVVGIDDKITPDTKFVLMIYENSNLFPQFINNNLTFHVPQGTRAYLIADGILINQGYIDPNLSIIGIYTKCEDDLLMPQSFISRDAGNYSQFALFATNTFVSYWHLSMLFRLPDILKQGDMVAISGNTGFSLSPRLTLNFIDSALSNDFRVIYLRLCNSQF